MSTLLGYGDKVEVNGHEGKIVSIWYDFHGNRTARVEFDDKTLIPPEMEVPESKLKKVNGNHSYYDSFYDNYDYLKKFGPVEEFCPKCGTKWTVTVFNNHKWKDCKKCNKKYEDLI